MSDNLVTRLRMNAVVAVPKTVPGWQEARPYHLSNQAADRIEALQAEIARLREALQHYTHCRHAVPDCFCTKEAREASE